jgi:hypothetical protein
LTLEQPASIATHSKAPHGANRARRAGWVNDFVIFDPCS